MAPRWHADPTVDLLGGSRVVQVSTFLDDQLLAVRQLRPESGRSSRPWRQIAVSAAVCVLAGVALLWGQPGLGALLLLPGIGLGVAAALRQRRPSRFWVGPDHRADLPLAGPAIPLVQAGPSVALLLIPEGAAGEVILDGERLALDELARSSDEHPGAQVCALPEDARARLQLGPCTLLVESLLPARRVRGALFGELDRDARLSGGCSLALHAVVMALALAVPPSPRTLSLDLFQVDRVWVRLPPPALPRGARYVSWRPGALGEGSGRRARGDEGKAGSPHATGPPKLFALKGPPQNPDPHLAAQLARAAAQGAGVLELLGPESGTHLAGLLGRGSAIGYDAENALGNLVGSGFGEAYGVGGLGLTGTGRGGGGRGEGYIGLGQMGTLGRGAGIGRGAGYGRGVGRLGSYRARACQHDNCIVSAGAMNVRGSMGKELIRRVVRRHINEWRYCYERELQASPNMHGRVTLQFIIAPTGKVVTSSVKDSAIGNARVESCLARAVRRWQFPACNCGGLVIVTYPVLLNVAGW